MQDPFGHSEYEEHHARSSAKAFEQMLREESFYFMDLGTIDEIYHYYASNRQWKKAQQLLEFGLKSHPSSSDLYYKQSKLYFDLDQYPLSLEQVDIALQFSPMNAEYLFFKADILTQIEDYQEALEVLKQLHGIHHHPEEVLIQMGNIAQACGKNDVCESYYREALEVAPDFEEALYELVFFLESQSRHAEGIKLYEEYIDRFPYSYNVWYNMGMLYRSLDNAYKAIEAFDFAIVIKEDFLSAYYNKGLLLADQDRYEDALRTFLEANAIDSTDVPILYHIAECYENLNMFRDAVRYYKLATKEDDTFVDAWMGLGFCMERCEKYMEAIHFYRKAYNLDQENTEICLAIAVCEYKLGNKLGSYQFLEKAIHLDPHDSQLWQDWAELLFEHGSVQGAVSYLEEGIKINPDNYSLYYQCAAYLLSIGDHQGLTYLENALLIDYPNHYSLFHHVPVLKDNKMVQEMIELYGE